MDSRYLTPAQARRFYDRFGERQDSQGFYEDAALDVLLREGAFDTARGVLEFGCGTGRLACRLLQGPLPGEAVYFGCDISATMVALARERLDPFKARATVWQSDGPADFSPAAGKVDRVVTTYVLDLLPPDEIGAFLDAAAAILPRNGRLCCVGLTFADSGLARVTSGIWAAVARIRPQLVGGCRPLHLSEMLAPQTWKVLHRSVVTPWSVASEIVIAQRL